MAQRVRNWPLLAETWGAGVDTQEKEFEFVPLLKKQKIYSGQGLWLQLCLYVTGTTLRPIYTFLDILYQDLLWSPFLCGDNLE